MLETINRSMNFSKKKIILIGIFVWFVMNLLFFLPLPLGNFDDFKAPILQIFVISFPIFMIYLLLAKLKGRIIKTVLLSLIAIPLTIILFLYTLGFFTVVSEFTPLRELDTYYTAGFSQEKFDSIKIGATKEEVTQILGDPFYKDDLSLDREYWQYTKSGKLGDPGANDLIGGLYIRIWFDKDGKVDTKSNSVFY